MNFLTSINIIDIVIILVLALGALIGFKRGVISSLVHLLGTIIIIVVAYYLKNPIASLLFNIFPFINLESPLASSFVINVLFYEMIAFILISALLFGIFKYVMYVSKFIEKIMKLTVVLGAISKILGAIVGLVQYVFICFMLLFILNLPIFNMEQVKTSNLANKILNGTPLFSTVIKKPLESIRNMEGLVKSYSNKNDKNYNLKALDIMLNTKILTTNSADIIIKHQRIDLPGSDKVIDKYRRK